MWIPQRFCWEKGICSYFKKLEDYDNIHFIDGDIVSIILEELKNDGKNIFLFGGGVTLAPFISRDVIDEYIIGIIPVILGKGKRLFAQESDILLELKLTKYLIDDGILILRYSKC